MEILSDFERCIICCEAPADSLEHILSDAIGGRLKARILCRNCNNWLGHQLVGIIKNDPSIRLAIEYLKNELPTTFQDYMTFIGTTPEGPIIKVKQKKGIRKVISQNYQDILIQDTGDALRTLERKLAKSGLPPIEIDALISEFKQLEENEPLETPTGEIFIKKPMPNLRPELSTQQIDDRFPVLIAYEFLAVALGKSIYHHIFDDVRDYIVSGSMSNKIIVNHFGGGKSYDAMHGLIIEPLENGVLVIIRLFRWITYQVRFEGFRYGGPDAVYVEDLRTPQSLIALSREDARNGKWLSG